MAATGARIGFGTMLQRDAGGSPSSYSDIGEVIDPGTLSASRDTVDATHTTSANRFREFIGGMRDGGELSFTVAMVPEGSAYAELWNDLKDNTAVGYRWAIPNAAGTANYYWYFNGFVTSIASAVPLEDRMTAAVTIKITGEPVLSS